jgi:nucleoside-diphosphate-sugar epimerase
LYVSKAVWFLQKEFDSFFDLTELNTGFQIGPSISRRPNHQSNLFIRNLVMGNTKLNFNAQFPTIDVRDAALAHLKILPLTKSFNLRLNLIQGTHFMRDISEVLKDEFEQYHYVVSTGVIGSIPIKLLSLFERD